MLKELGYDRQRAVAYARRWAYSRNPLFYNFTGIGGDCTNFISQCLLAGCCVMNCTPTFGWYYRNASDRAPAHSFDALDRPLESYTYEQLRPLKILGARAARSPDPGCFSNLLNGLALPGAC